MVVRSIGVLCGGFEGNLVALFVCVCRRQMEDNKRSIPCLVDGFKPSQRKVLFSCFKRNLKKEIKVFATVHVPCNKIKCSAPHFPWMALDASIVVMGLVLMLSQRCGVCM